MYILFDPKVLKTFKISLCHVPCLLVIKDRRPADLINNSFLVDYYLLAASRLHTFFCNTVPTNLLPSSKINSPIGEWKSSFPPFYYRKTDRQTDMRSHWEVKLLIICISISLTLPFVKQDPEPLLPIHKCSF